MRLNDVHRVVKSMRDRGGTKVGKTVLSGARVYQETGIGPWQEPEFHDFARGVHILVELHIDAPCMRKSFTSVESWPRKV